MHIQGILFDLDGTLANTIPLCVEAFRQTFAQFLGRLLTDEEIIAYFGLVVSEEGIIQRVMPEQAEAGLQCYLAIYKQLHADYREPFADIKTALELLKTRGIRMAVVTGKGEQAAHLSLRYLGIEHYFDQVETGNAHVNVKAVAIGKILAAWQMEPRHAAYIGDADTDMQQAVEAGVLPLAACWAETSTIHRLSSLQPFATFVSVQSFIAWLNEHLLPAGVFLP